MEPSPRNSPRRRWRPTTALIAVMTVLALLAAACGGGDDDDEGVATLTDDGGVASDDGPVDDVRSDEDAALEFSVCMREGGIDGFPDPEVTQDGSITYPIAELLALDGIQDGGSEIGDTFITCLPLIQGVTFGGVLGGAITDLQDTTVAFGDCLRDQGLDVGDPDVGSGQNVAGGQLDENSDRYDLIGAVYGVDPEDPEVRAALEACEPVLAQLEGLVPGADG